MGIRPKRASRRPAWIVLIAAAIYAIAAVSRGYSPNWSGGLVANIAGHRVPPLQALLNAFSFFFSANKGLLIYCPIMLLSLVWIPISWRTCRLVPRFRLS